ncbi:MAG: hypothetical protein AVDCRST_MAG79-2973, partial [uncultured Thermoleophilia bacterium]
DAPPAGGLRGPGAAAARPRPPDARRRPVRRGRRRGRGGHAVRVRGNGGGRRGRARLCVRGAARPCGAARARHGRPASPPRGGRARQARP